MSLSQRVIKMMIDETTTCFLLSVTRHASLSVFNLNLRRLRLAVRFETRFVSRAYIVWQVLQKIVIIQMKRTFVD